MIIVFGPISMELHMDIPGFPEGEQSVFTEDYTLNAGGKAANQALAAARSGAKVAVIGKTGNDDFSKRILDKIRYDGVVTSGVGKLDDIHTGLETIYKLPDGKLHTIKSKGANAQSEAEQVPDEILDDKAIVLVQTELPQNENIALLQRAKQQGATTMLNLAPTLNLSAAMLESIDILIVNSNEASKLAEKLGLGTSDSTEKLAKALAQIGKLTCIITVGENGSIAFNEEGSGYKIGALKLEAMIDHSGAEDAYCGTLAACFQAGMPLSRAMKRASIAASLTCMKEGSQSSLPYLDDIDQRINDLEDAVEI